ncbi:N-acetyltransferase family protein [Luteolibacter sp. Populi]|uniref:GNAT family N-acetyltransferase n=1 Tax=Luteolibacter sp. Populi TaxID=3230487 RepID=UPI0034675FB1
MSKTACYLIRKASEHEATRIAGIHVAAWRAAYRGLIPDDYLDSLDPLQRAVTWKALIGAPEELVMVAVRGTRVAGFCSLQASRDPAAPPEIAEISSLYVEPREWRHGAGSSLVAAAVDHATKHRFVALTLWVLATNERARQFYAAAGFEPDGTEKEDRRLGFPIHELRYRRGL